MCIRDSFSYMHIFAVKLPLKPVACKGQAEHHFLRCLGDVCKAAYAGELAFRIMTVNISPSVNLSGTHTAEVKAAALIKIELT